MCAAKELLAHGIDVIVLEARDRVGGRTLTKRVETDKNEDGSAFWCDLGGSYVGPTQNRVLNLIEELNLTTYMVEDSKDIAYLRAKDDDDGLKSSRRELKVRNRPDKDPNLGGLLQWLDYVNTVRKIDSYGSQIPPNAPWKAKQAREWDSKTFKQFVDETCWTREVKDYFNNVFTQIDVCCESNEISMLWFLWYVAQCGGYGRSIATTNGGQERKINGGSQQISEKLMQSLNENNHHSKQQQQHHRQQRVFLSKVVHKIVQSTTSAMVTCLDGSQFEAEYLIMAMPTHLWLKIHYEPALPACKNLLAQRSSMGTVGKLILYYDKPFWFDANLSGCIMIESRSRKSHPIILTLDETKPDGSHAAIIGFMGARGWFEMRNKDTEEVGRIAAQSYVDATGLQEFRNFKRVERFDWCSEQYSGGCYTSAQVTNTLTKYGPCLRETFGRIHYAGTETAIKWSGYMEGAVSAGKRAAREILHRMGRMGQDEIWQEEPDATNVPPKPFLYPACYRWLPSVETLIYTTSIVVLSAGAIGAIFFMRAHCAAMSSRQQ